MQYRYILTEFYRANWVSFQHLEKIEAVSQTREYSLNAMTQLYRYYGLSHEIDITANTYVLRYVRYQH
jgi:hypothetical protein